MSNYRENLKYIYSLTAIVLTLTLLIGITQVNAVATLPATDSHQMHVNGASWTTVEPAAPAPAGIIFETNFANDGAYSQTQAPHGDWVDVQDNPPEGFAGVVVTDNGRVYGVPGSGVDGGVAMKVEYSNNPSAPENMMYVHLTGDANTGYNELYIRYTVRFPEGIMIGDPASEDIPYWKFGRLWQNSGPTEPGGNWSENRVDSGYVVWNWNGTDTYGLMNEIVYSAATGNDLGMGSNGGERYSTKWYTGIPSDFTTAPGYFNAVGQGGWDFDQGTRLMVNTPQQWHTLEWRFKLATNTTSNDGVVQVWFDGVEQIPPTQGKSSNAPDLPDLTPSEMPTAPIAPSNGWNLVTIMDNMAPQWHEHWDEPHAGAGETRNPEDIKNGIFFGEVVISTERVGHTYRVGSGQ